MPVSQWMKLTQCRNCDCKGEELVLSVNPKSHSSDSASAVVPRSQMVRDSGSDAPRLGWGRYAVNINTEQNKNTNRQGRTSSARMIPNLVLGAKTETAGIRRKTKSGDRVPAAETRMVAIVPDRSAFVQQNIDED